MRLTRRQLVASGAAALGAAGIYELVDRFAVAPERQTVRVLPSEQHVLGHPEVIVDNEVEVVVPPLHHEVVTAVLRVEPTAAALSEARASLNETLQELDARYEPAPKGLSISLGWGLPYFARYVSDLAEEHLPVDLRASKAAGRTVRGVIDAIRFPSDPEQLVLEDNDLAIFFRGDNREFIEDASSALFDDAKGLFELTSIRRGFAGGGFDGSQSLPKQMAMAAGIGGAELIPDTAELFLGFTTTQKAGLGPPGIANFETLPGYTDQFPDGYFLGGTAMHLSHLFEDVEAWYLNFDYPERVSTTFKPGLDVKDGTQTVPQDGEDADGTKAVEADAERYDAVGHSSVMQPASRLQVDVTGNDGISYPKGTAVPQRADFNTLDNPFFWSARPDIDRQSDGPAAGLHFVVFTPTSDDFHRTRLAMDGVLPDGTTIPFHPRSRGQGFNSILQTTHRQNFLVPPRRNRSFPLSELL
ncbi:MAG TPA: hypothetical protein VH281_00310 [Gaiellaceae bacterium]